MAHPLDDGTAVMLYRSLDQTAQGLGRDGAAYRRMLSPIVRNWSRLERYVLGPLRLPLRPGTLLALSWFGVCALLPARLVALAAFRGERARAMWAGMCRALMLPLERPASSAAAAPAQHAGSRRGLAHGARRLANRLPIRCRPICEAWAARSGRALPLPPLMSFLPLDSVLFDVTPRQLLKIAGDKYCRKDTGNSSRGIATGRACSR